MQYVIPAWEYTVQSHSLPTISKGVVLFVFRFHTLFHQWFSMTFPWLLQDLYLIFHDQKNDSFSAVPLKMVYLNMEQENSVWNMLCLSETNQIGLLALHAKATQISHQQNTSTVKCHFTFHYYTVCIIIIVLLFWRLDQI